MQIIAKGNRWLLFASRHVYAWFELWVEYDYYNYIASVTVLTVQIGFEWIWIKKRNGLKKGSKQIIWRRNA